ncbi:hypothetical protein COY14_04270 [Candidatus Roizmanbacteria bacterium CG_4_10_14_0_2_um_filter_36_9]|uniref:Uncharacterized protein n=1 Tax=Candidatus Roizmanbacteria bacterium CG_4_10_14_0_2_um_filter_36_9 TaxID=1974823 RepID=A0A2M7U2V6_9BACT|nr:MAG: hypothetical protein COY14_04270 [Candidatus Roizmanbacteria bacterium CG_4_10_14_0_2_um_filter_36_9]
MKNINKMYLIIIVLVVFVIGLLLYAQNNKSSKAPSVANDKSMNEGSDNVEAQNTSTPGPIVVPFDYTITSVTDDTILMNGEKGEMILPNDPSVVTVFFRENGVDTPTTFSEVKAEMKANLVIDPGKSATLYLIR